MFAMDRLKIVSKLKSIPRVISVKNLSSRRSPTPDDHPLRATFSEHIFNIYNGTNSVPFEELYRYVESSELDTIHADCGSAISRYLLENIHNYVGMEPGVAFMTAFGTFWERFQSNTQTLANICLAIDRSQRDTVTTIAKDAFRTLYVQMETLEPKIILTFLRLVEKMRTNNSTGDDFDTYVVRVTETMFRNLGLEDWFAERVFATTRDFYENLGQTMSKDLRINEYLQFAFSKLQEETLRLEFFYMRNLKPHIRSIIIGRMLHRQLDDLMERTDEIYQMYDLYDKCTLETVNEIMIVDSDFVRPLARKLTDYIEKKGTMTLESEPSALAYIETIENTIFLKNRIDNMVTNYFNSRPVFQNAVRLGFERFINAYPQFSRVLVTYIDALLKNKATTDDTCKDFLALFRYLECKEDFQACYTNHLEKRLLRAANLNIKAEDLLIEGMKAVCGESFTAKMEGMLKDIKSSEDFYREAMQVQCEDFNVLVLTKSYWPDFDNPVVKLPGELQEAIVQFGQKFQDRYPKKKLTWQMELGSVSMAVGNSGKEVVVTLIQAAILLLFNSKDSYTVEELIENLEMCEVKFRRSLDVMLSHQLLKINDTLCEDHNVPAYLSSDYVTVNDNFSDDTCCLQSAPNLYLAEEPTVRTITHEVSVRVDAAIMRLMKREVRVHHAQVVAEVGHMAPSLNDLKKRIEWLIERDYMRRDGNIIDVYTYVP